MVDDDTNIVDEILWSSKRSVGALTDRLEQLQSGALSPEARTLADRFPDALPDSMAALSDPQWPELDDDENAILSTASARLAKRGVASSAADPDRRLDMLSGATSELRTAWGTSESRCVEWAGLFLPDADLDGQRDEIPSSLAEAESIAVAAASLGLQTPEPLPGEQEWDALRTPARGVIELADRLESAEQATRSLAQQHVPTLSLLVGPLGAAKMVTLAGGRERLARMPSGSLQVLGASGAMAAHRRGAPLQNTLRSCSLCPKSLGLRAGFVVRLPVILQGSARLRSGLITSMESHGGMSRLTRSIKSARKSRTGSLSHRRGDRDATQARETRLGSAS